MTVQAAEGATVQEVEGMTEGATSSILGDEADEGSTAEADA